MLMALPAMAQSSKITAKVIDSETKDGVIGAIVEVVSKSNANYRKHATTGLTENFKLVNILSQHIKHIIFILHQYRNPHLG